MEDLQLITPVAAIALGLNYLGMWLKNIPWFKDWWIPVFLPVVGAIVFPFIFQMPDIGDEFLAGPDIPLMTKIVYGMGMGFTAVGLHQAPKQFGNREINLDVRCSN